MENAVCAVKMMKIMSKHIPTEQLINFADGILTGGESGNVQTHLKGCESCKTELSRFEKVLGVMRADVSADAPTESVMWAKNLFCTRQFAPRETMVQKILAVLQVDISQLSPAFGERSAATAAQMLFQAGDNSVDLRVSLGEKGLKLMGQVLGGGFENCSIILRGGKKDITASANELAEFTLTGVKAGTYEMTLTSGTRQIVLESLVLK
jgi:hypothetical protein